MNVDFIDILVCIGISNYAIDIRVRSVLSDAGRIDELV